MVIASDERKGDGKREPDVARHQRMTKSKETERKEWEYLPVYRRDERILSDCRWR